MFGWKKRRNEEREAYLEAMRLVVGAVERQLEVTRAQTEALQTYLNFLYASGEPEARTMRDEDEWNAEVERAKRARVWQREES